MRENKKKQKGKRASVHFDNENIETYTTLVKIYVFIY